MEIKEQDYYIYYHNETSTIHFQGVLRLSLEDYVPISQLLDEVIQLEPPLITVDFRELKFINSSGFTMIARFIAKVSAKKHLNMTLLVDQKNPWQQKSLNNYKRLMPKLEFQWT